MQLTTVFKVHPEYAVALEALKAHGGRMTVPEWFSSDPRLAEMSPSDKIHIVKGLHQQGCISNGGRKKVPRSPGTRKGTDWRIEWRVV